MKKIPNMILLLIVFSISITMFSSCMFYSDRLLIAQKVPDKNNLTKAIQNIVDAINSKDKGELLELFSNTAINKDKDIDIKIDMLFELVQGDIETWEYGDEYGFVQDLEVGQRWEGFQSSLIITTHEAFYRLYLTLYTIDEEVPDNVGIESLQIAKANESPEDFIFDDTITGIMIWTPEKIDEWLKILEKQNR